MTCAIFSGRPKTRKEYGAFCWDRPRTASLAVATLTLSVSYMASTVRAMRSAVESQWGEDQELHLITWMMTLCPFPSSVNHLFSVDSGRLV